MRRANTIPVWYLHECLVYAPDTGALLWQQRPASHFGGKTDVADGWNTRFAGGSAFVVRNRAGYLRGNLRFEGERYELLAHRVAFAMHTGQWAEEEVDHINRDRSDNRAVNLRPASRNLNGFNRNFPPNSTGLTGIQRSGRGFKAIIRLNKRKTYLGTFDTPEEAHAAYLAAARAHHGDVL